jgi:hypothetical protein
MSDKPYHNDMIRNVYDRATKQLVLTVNVEGLLPSDAKTVLRLATNVLNNHDWLPMPTPKPIGQAVHDIPTINDIRDRHGLPPLKPVNTKNNLR